MLFKTLEILVRGLTALASHTNCRSDWSLPGRPDIGRWKSGISWRKSSVRRGPVGLVLPHRVICSRRVPNKGPPRRAFWSLPSSFLSSAQADPPAFLGPSFPFFCLLGGCTNLRATRAKSFRIRGSLPAPSALMPHPFVSAAGLSLEPPMPPRPSIKFVRGIRRRRIRRSAGPACDAANRAEELPDFCW